MIKRIAGFGIVAFWLGLTCIRCFLFLPEDTPEYTPIKEYGLIKATVLDVTEKKSTEQCEAEAVELIEMVLEEYTAEEKMLMARLGMSEAGILEVKAIQGVIQTAMNRKNSDDYPDTIEGVIYQRINGHRQFSTQGEPRLPCEYLPLKHQTATAPATRSHSEFRPTPYESVAVPHQRVRPDD